MSYQPSLDTGPFHVKRQQYGNPSQYVLQPEKEEDKKYLVILFTIFSVRIKAFPTKHTT